MLGTLGFPRTRDSPANVMGVDSSLNPGSASPWVWFGVVTSCHLINLQSGDRAADLLAMWGPGLAHTKYLAVYTPTTSGCASGGGDDKVEESG